MINFLKKYWVLILIVVMGINFLCFYFAEESIGVSDTLEHGESNEMIRRFERRNNFYTLFLDFVFILDCWFAFFLLYLMIRGFVKKMKLVK
ncbi:hypothetical protein CHRYSEOSP005_16590 [Chryseobacterium sp. Alg-005]